jgi:zinc protease
MGLFRGRDARRLGFAGGLAGGVALAVFAIANFASAPPAPAAPAQAAASAGGQEQGVLRATLPNGLRVILVRNTLAPVVATSVNYLVGSNDAPEGFPGMAHAQEHMLFRGSPGLSADQLANIGSVMGGNFNANTRENLTQYLFTVPSEDLDVALHIEAIRMQNVNDSDKDWGEERGAIEQEVAQDVSNPNYVMFSKLREIMFAGTPYEHDALGTRPSFDKTTGQMLRAFYDKWYAPNNAILVVVGDLDPQATMTKIRTLFGSIPRKQLPAHAAIAPKPLAPSLPIVVPTDRANGSSVLAMRMPGLDSADFPALEVLSDVLNSERSDLYALVPEGKALATGFSLDPLPKVGMGYVSISFPADGDAKVAEAELRATVQKILRDGVPADLVEAAKIQEERQAEFQKNSIAGLASIWSEAVAAYNLISPDEDLQRIKKVTVADVNRVARQYIDLDHSVSAVLAPRGGGRPVASSGFGGQESIALGEAQPTKLPDWAESALNRLSVPTSTVHPTVTTLSNGLTLIVQPEDVSDTVTLYGHIKTRPELLVPAGKEGMSQVLSELFNYGSEKLDRIAFQEALDQIGAEESAGTDFTIQVLSRDLDRGAELLADNELHPAFPQQAMDIVKGQVARVVAAQLQSPGYMMQRSLRESLFPKTDPSLREATPVTVRSLNLEDVKAYYHSAFRPDLTSIVVVGRITPERARAVVEKYFGAWKAEGPKPPTELPAVPANMPNVVAVPDESRVQDSVVLAQTIGVTRSHPDYYALELGSAVLGGSFYSTRLSIDLRKNAGLVYSVGSDVNAGKTRGNYFVQYACDPQNVSKANAMVVQELKRMQDTPVGQDELGRVKALMLRQIPLGESSVGQIARGLAGRWELDLPLDEPTQAARRYIALGPAEIQAAFKKWVQPENLVRVSQGPAPQ